MTSHDRHVGIVVDLAFGERFQGLPAEMPIWVIDTVANRGAMTECRSGGASVGSRSITTFVSLPNETPEEACERILSAVDTHHNALSQNPAYLGIEVFGARPTAALRQALGAYGLTVVEETEVRFVAQRPGWAQEARER
jgi:hypothetical protein